MEQKKDESESSNIDLDSLLLELCALENQLLSSSSVSDPHTLNSTTSVYTSSFFDQKHFEPGFNDTRRQFSSTTSKNSYCIDQSITEFASSNSELTTPTDTSGIQGDVTNNVCFSSDSPLDDNVIQNGEHAFKQDLSPGNRTQSPDNDSAFCDSGSLTSSESILSTNNGHVAKVAKLCADRKNFMAGNKKVENGVIAEQTRQISAFEEKLDSAGNDEETKDRLKAEKIKKVLDKMHDANVKKINVKIFYKFSNVDVFIDERLNVACILRHLAKQFNIEYSMNHALVEICPDLHIERIYEDHENLLENVELWAPESTNEIHLCEKSIKYDLFCNPQVYLLRDNTTPMHDTAAKQRFIMDYFSSSQMQLPETSGFLYLKSDGKKSWKKFYFTLRLSGLYVCTKGPKSKSSKDLVCLSQLDNIQIYNGVGWKKKYKAPTDFGFALKHPKIQVKSSKYIKYLCVENEETLKIWLTSLRLSKHGKTLFDNFVDCCEHVSTDESTETALICNGDADDSRISNTAVDGSASSVQKSKDFVVSIPPLSIFEEETKSVGSQRSSFRRSRDAVDDDGSTSSLRSRASGRHFSGSIHGSVPVPLPVPVTVPYNNALAMPYSFVADRRTVPFNDVVYRAVSFDDVITREEMSSDDNSGDPSVSAIAERSASAAEKMDSEEDDEEEPKSSSSMLDHSKMFQSPSQRGRGHLAAGSVASSKSASASDAAVVLSSFSCDYTAVVDSATIRRRKIPPAPPKRSDSTRLSSASMTSSGYSLNDAPSISSAAATQWSATTSKSVPQSPTFDDSSAITAASLAKRDDFSPATLSTGRIESYISDAASVNAQIPAPPPAHSIPFCARKLNAIQNFPKQSALAQPTKPPVPAKPKFLPSTSADTATTELKSPSNVDFHSELRLAMQRRLSKVNSGVDSTLGLP